MEHLKQKAIEQYLAKPEYPRYACCCVGAKEIPNFKLEKKPYELQMVNQNQRSSFIIKIHKEFSVSLAQAKEMVVEPPCSEGEGFLLP